MEDKYLGITKEAFNAMFARYEAFQESCSDITKEPVKVYSPLSEKSLHELELIREASKDLQRKKEEDVRKAAQAAEENEEQETQVVEETQTETEK